MPTLLRVLCPLLLATAPASPARSQTSSGSAAKLPPFAVLGPDTAAIAAYVAGRAQAWGLRADETTEVLQDEVDNFGNRHVRIGRRVGRFPVAFEQIRLHARLDGRVYAEDLEISNLGGYTYEVPAIDPARAEAIARGDYRGALLGPANPTLVIVTGRAGVTPARLAYRVQIAYQRLGTEPVVRDVFVDARTGAVLLTNTHVYHLGATTMTSPNVDGQSIPINVYDYGSDGIAMLDAVTMANGGYWYVLNGANNENIFLTPNTSTPYTDGTAVSAHDEMKRVLEYYAASYGWTQWDFNSHPASSGGILALVVHYGASYGNAGFTTFDSAEGQVGLMVLGDGDGYYTTNFVRCEDVFGHEMGHGVVTGTAGLLYHTQSGAINEHVADVFGWLHDPADDLVGEECVGPGAGYAIRDICDPTALGQPGHMASFVVSPDTEEGDWGGVHTNSGIPNRAACVARNAIGATKVGLVWFQTLRYHLGPTSQFADLARSSVVACDELVSIPSNDCVALASAWVSVGLAIDDSAGACPAGSTLRAGTCFCDAGHDINSAGTGCEATTAGQCPANSSPAGDYCLCNPGYVVDSSGLLCVPESQAACPVNSHRVGGECVCNECYQGSPFDRGCSPIPNCVSCTDPLRESVGGTCQCIAGTTELCGADTDPCCTTDNLCGWEDDGFCDCGAACGWDVNDCGGAPNAAPSCAAIVGDCGNETWWGRCDGTFLIYCDDRTDPSNPRIVAGDCAGAGANYYCALDGNLGYNCVERVDPCNGVPATGECVAGTTTARYCNGQEVVTVDCLDNGCADQVVDGTPIEWCLPCPPDAFVCGSQCCVCGENASPCNGDECCCDAGFVVNAAGDACVPEDGDPDDPGPDDGEDDNDRDEDRDDGGGSSGSISINCASAGPLPWAASLALLPLWRRRRR